MKMKNILTIAIIAVVVAFSCTNKHDSDNGEAYVFKVVNAQGDDMLLSSTPGAYNASAVQLGYNNNGHRQQMGHSIAHVGGYTCVQSTDMAKHCGQGYSTFYLQLDSATCDTIYIANTAGHHGGGHSGGKHGVRHKGQQLQSETCAQGQVYTLHHESNSHHN